jgi:hypothetical protein
MAPIITPDDMCVCGHTDDDHDKGRWCALCNCDAFYPDEDAR